MTELTKQQHDEILALMQDLDIQQCCVSWSICQDGPKGPNIISKEMMISVGYENSSIQFIPIREFVWNDNRDKIKRLEELIW